MVPDKIRLPEERNLPCGGTKEGEGRVEDDPLPVDYPLENILRKTSLDELPQFINLQEGEMCREGPADERHPPARPTPGRKNPAGDNLTHPAPEPLLF